MGASLVKDAANTAPTFKSSDANFEIDALISHKFTFLSVDAVRKYPGMAGLNDTAVVAFSWAENWRMGLDAVPFLVSYIKTSPLSQETANWVGECGFQARASTSDVKVHAAQPSPSAASALVLTSLCTQESTFHNH